MTHAAPLLQSLDLQPLDDRRRIHISKLMETMIAGQSHPAFNDFFEVDSDGVVATKFMPRLRAGAKRFAVMGPAVYNDARLHPGV